MLADNAGVEFKPLQDVELADFRPGAAQSAKLVGLPSRTLGAAVIESHAAVGAPPNRGAAGTCSLGPVAAGRAAAPAGAAAAATLSAQQRTGSSVGFSRSFMTQRRGLLSRWAAAPDAEKCPNRSPFLHGVAVHTRASSRAQPDPPAASAASSS